MIIKPHNTPWTRVTDYLRNCKTEEELNKVGDKFPEDIKYLKENYLKSLETTFKWLRHKIRKESIK